jgi:hypothetical protein
MTSPLHTLIDLKLLSPNPSPCEIHIHPTIAHHIHLPHHSTILSFRKHLSAIMRLMELHCCRKLSRCYSHIEIIPQRSASNDGDITKHRLISDETPHVVSGQFGLLIGVSVRRTVNIVIPLICALIVVEFPDFRDAGSPA